MVESKREHNKRKGQKEIPKYPYIGVNTNDDLVILFTKSNTGMVINITKEGKERLGFNLGSYSEVWKESNFGKLNGTIILENK